MGAGDRAVLIENVMGGDVEEPPPLTAGGDPAALEHRAAAPLVLYTGTFEPYQGLDMLLDASAILAEDASARACAGRRRPAGAGGGGARARRGAARAAIFTGHQPAREIPAFRRGGGHPRLASHRGHQHAAEDLPYLRAGKPIVATDLLTHTQVLDREMALLVAPEPAAFAAALERLLADPARRAAAGACCRRARAERYSREVYVTRTRLVCERLTAAGLRTRVPAVPHA